MLSNPEQLLIIVSNAHLLMHSNLYNDDRGRMYLRKYKEFLRFINDPWGKIVSNLKQWEEASNLDNFMISFMNCP